MVSNVAIGIGRAYPIAATVVGELRYIAQSVDNSDGTSDCVVFMRCGIASSTGSQKSSCCVVMMPSVH